MLKFSHVIFYVSNISDALSFYERAFCIKARFVHESGTYAELETGAVAIAFASEELARMNIPQGVSLNSIKKPPQASEVVFETDNVHATYQSAIDEGALAVSAPSEKPWGQTVAYVRDPNGILIEIASPIN